MSVEHGCQWHHCQYCLVHAVTRVGVRRYFLEDNKAGQACPSPSLPQLPLMAFSENSMQLEIVLELEGLCLSLGSEELNPEEREMSCYVTCNTLAAALYIPYPGALTKVI